jgi:cellulose synthase/poly-beta-1,6-N-acetylglucosamine synthase-like glycosyltransferase
VSLSLSLALVLAAGLLGLALRTEEQRRTAPPLPPPSSVPPNTVTVLLPVRDERDNVLDCLETLLGQSARVRVVDDGSTDGTREIVAKRQDVELVDAGPLREGWRGKVHALRVGWQGVDTPWVLLTDADTRHDPGLLSRALAAARDLDAVSLAGTQECRSFGERLIIPAVFGLLDALLGDWQAAASGAGPAVANGQFILLRKEAWDAAGGFETVRNEPIDDVAIVTRLRQRGSRTAFFREPGLRVRMYRGLGETWRGWRRNLGGIFGPRPQTLAAVLAVLLVPVFALAGFVAAGRWVEAALLWSAGAAASIVFRSGSAYGLLYPLDAVLLAILLGLGAADRRRGRLASWKGREMRI